VSCLAATGAAKTDIRPTAHQGHRSPMNVPK
jgi:hypothetical protein